MITIKELHSYIKLSSKGLVPKLVCPVDYLHENMTPWMDEDDKTCLWCIFCNSKVYLGSEKEKYIKELLHQ
jgi:flavoprotein